jgi:hypothetical protein
MPVPWLRLLDIALGVADWGRSRARGRKVSITRIGERGMLEARVAGVIAGALGEVFSRDRRREDAERRRLEEERREAERQRRLILMREIGDREIGRLRLVAGLALAAWIGSLFVAVMLPGDGIAPRVAVVVAWMLLLSALTVALGAQVALAHDLARLSDPDRRQPTSGAGGTIAAWLLVLGLVLTASAALFV